MSERKVELSKNEFWRFTENNKANSTRGKKGKILENIFFNVNFLFCKIIIYYCISIIKVTKELLKSVVPNRYATAD